MAIERGEDEDYPDGFMYLSSEDRRQADETLNLFVACAAEKIGEADEESEAKRLESMVFFDGPEWSNP